MRIISASLSPNTDVNDRIQSLLMLLTPWRWQYGQHLERVKEWFSKRFVGFCGYPVNSGRGALYLLLTSFGIGRGDEVLVQSFTCVAVPNSVLWTGATPVYIDIDSSLNLDVNDAKKKITKRTKALIVQHTLGYIADMQKIKTFAKQYGLLVIEDCAHALGATYHDMDVGSMGDAAFFSFGRDKVVSSVFGGYAIIRSDHRDATQKMQYLVAHLPKPSYFWIFQQLMHPLIFSIVIPLYTSGIGKGILWVAQKIRIVSFPVYAEEKKGCRPSIFPSSYPNALAGLLIHQLDKLQSMNEARRRSAALYASALSKNSHIELCSSLPGSIFLRFPIFISQPDELIGRVKRKGILLGNWYHHVIDPKGVEYESVLYHYGSCVNAEAAAKKIVNLPTLVTIQEIERVLDEVTSV